MPSIQGSVISTEPGAINEGHPPPSSPIEMAVIKVSSRPATIVNPFGALRLFIVEYPIRRTAQGVCGAALFAASCTTP